VLARRRGDELVLRPFDASDRACAMRLAAELLPIVRSALGKTRDELEDELARVEAPVRHQRLKEGLLKLLDDRSTWSAPPGLDPIAARREVFLRAAEVRRALGAGEPFDRAAVLASVAAVHGLVAEQLERALYADLRGANVLACFEDLSADALVDAYEHGRMQAVLLRAVRIRVRVLCDSAAATRQLFRRLKFLGLLYTIERASGSDAFDIVVDGPLSLFQSVTRYGHRIAQLVPLLEPCGAYELEAELRWGKERVPLTFHAKGGEHASSALRGKKLPRSDGDDGALTAELSDFKRAFVALGTTWRVAPSRTVIDLPGRGLLIPDLVFSRQSERIYFEALGYWSREAVFRRVDLVQAGFAHKVLFAASDRLRVSEELLGEDTPAALYVYKGNIKARAVAEHLEHLASRSAR
jgi:predicted nuclease of restriction endonuclease-like RecB superfamily